MLFGVAMFATDYAIPKLRRRAQQAGRDPKSLPVIIFGAKPDKPTVGRLASAGVDRAVFFVPPASRETVLPLLDTYAGLVR